MYLTITLRGVFMYFKIYLNFFHNDKLKNLMDIYLYSFLCGFNEEGKDYIYSHYTNSQLVDIFGCSSPTVSNSITRLEKLGLVTRIERKGFSKKTFDFYCKRTLKVDTRYYKELSNEDYIYIQSHWLTDWKLPLRAVQLLGIFNSTYFKCGKEDTLVTTYQDIMYTMGNVNYRTYINNLNLLKDLGLIEEVTPKNNHKKVFKLTLKLIEDAIDFEEVLINNDYKEVASGKSNTFISWVKRYLSKNTNDKLSAFILDAKGMIVHKTLEPLWKAFNFYERLSIRASIPYDADHRAGYFVQGGI